MMGLQRAEAVPGRRSGKAGAQTLWGTLTFAEAERWRSKLLQHVCCCRKSSSVMQGAELSNVIEHG